MNKKELSRRIRFVRTESNLSQSQLADMIGISRPRVSAWEIGSAVPAEDDLKAIAKATKFPYDFFVEEEPIQAYELLKAEPSDSFILRSKNQFGDVNASPAINRDKKDYSFFLSSFLYIIVLGLSFFTVPFGVVFATAAVFLVPRPTKEKETKWTKLAVVIVRGLTLAWAVYLFGAFLFAFGWLPKWLTKVEVIGPE